MNTASPDMDARRRLLEQRLRKAQSPGQAASRISPRPGDSGTPLSSIQRRLWFLGQWQPDSAAYHVPVALALHGEVDAAQLEAALRDVARRHEILRTCYLDEDGEPVTVLRSEDDISLRVIQGEAVETIEQLLPLATAEASRPFALERELPLRAVLWRAGTKQSLLLVNLHHIAADGWSVGIVLRELGEAYKARQSGRRPATPMPALQYADFAYWQNQRLSEEVLERHLRVWRERLAHAPALLELPADRPRPAAQRSVGAIEAFRFGDDTRKALKVLAQREHVTPFMIFLAGLGALYQRYSGQGDMVIGTAVAGRESPEWEHLAGCFVNTLAMRVRPGRAMNSSDLLRQVREEWLAVVDHQALPFEALVEAVTPDRQFGHTPVFQVMLSINNVPRVALDLDGVDVRELPIDTGTAKFDLSWAIDDLDNALSGSLTYNTDLYDRATVTRMIGHLEQLLLGMVRAPDRPLTQLDWLDDDERHALLTTFNDTATPYPATRDIVELFTAHVERTPDAAAVMHEDTRVSYRELDAWSNRIAAYLQTLGAGADQRVGLYMERSHKTVAALLGILKAGAAYVPIDATYPADRVRFMLQDAGATLCLTELHLAAPFDPDSGVHAICMDRDEPLIAAQPATGVPIAHDASHLMYVLFTSGSTGRPKGVGVEHCHYLNYLHGVLQRLDVPQGSHFAMVSTFAADLGTTMLYGALSSGGCVHVMPHERVTDPMAFAQYMQKHRPDVLKLVPSHFETLCSMAPMEQLLPARCLVFAGEACAWETVRGVRAANPALDIQNHYGPTESSVAALTFKVPPLLPLANGTLPLGRPLGNVHSYVLDAHLQPVAIGIPGELHIGGAGITRGYLARPSLTAERFVPDPFGAPGSRLYRTGDLARVCADGVVEFLGRIDHQVKIRGYRVETAEIEALLIHEAVHETRVILREDVPGDKRLVAYLVMPRHQEPELVREVIEALRATLRAALPDYMVPTAFVPIPALPLNANGKLDRFALPAPSGERLLSSTDARLPRNALEAEIASVWSSLLGLESFGIDENFFDLGGDSFKAVRAVRGIGRGVSVMDLFRHPTVALLADHLSRATTAQDGLLHRLTPRDAGIDGVTWVCVPFGGGSAISYLALSAVVPQRDALYAVELPGHDYARPDDPLQPFDAVAVRCAEEIARSIHGSVMLYGHCLGAGMAVAIAQQLEARGTHLLGVIVGGSFPMPRLPGAVFDAISRVLPTDGLVSTRSILDGLLMTGGAAGDEDPRELEFLVRNMRHDGRQAENFYTRHYRSPDAPMLKAPLVCVVGERDRATEFHGEEYLEWQRFSPDVALEIIPGAGHFFQKHQASELAALGTQQAERWRRGTTTNKQTVVPAASSRVTTAAPAAKLSTFLLVSLGQLISVIGTGLSTFALGVWVYQQTGVVSDFAMMSALGILPGILVLPIAGAIADRWDRRKIMMACDLLGVLVVTVTAILAWTGRLHIGALYAVATLSAVASAFRQPAYTAAIAQLAPKRYLGHANGFVQLGGASGLLIGQMFGGVLMLRLGLDRILVLDIASFAIAFATLIAVRFPCALFRKQEEPFWKELTHGWRYILKRHGMIALAVFFALGNCLASMVLVLITPLVMAFSSTATLGSVMAMNGAGMLVGSLAMSLWGGLRRRVVGMVGFVALFGVSSLVIAAGPAAIYPMVGMFGVGVCTAFINAHWLSLVQVKVGLELQGRVIAANQMLARSLMPLGTLLAGWLVDQVFQPLFASARVTALVEPLVGSGAARGTALMIFMVGVLSIALTALGLLYPPLRRLEDVLPDAIPDAVILDKDVIQQQADAALALRTNVRSIVGKERA